MTSVRRVLGSRHALAAAAFAALVAATACDRGSRTPAIDSTTGLPVAPAADSTATSASAWDPSFGTGLLVPAGGPAVALGVSPDTETLGLDEGTPVTLLSRGGAVERATISTAMDEADGCSGLPAWRLGGTALRPWTVGFVGADIQPLVLDSLESLSRADSTRFATMATRTASALPSRGFERFTGLPFVPEDLWRLRLTTGQGDTADVIAAILVRRLNLEAQPLQEHTFLLFEVRGRGEPVVERTERSQGTEEHIETRDVIGAVRFGASGAVTLIVSRDYGDAVAFSLLQRDASGRWTVRWTSPRTSC